MAQEQVPHVSIALPGAAEGSVLPTHWPNLQEVLDWCHAMHPGTAAILVLLGVLYLLFGYYMFKALVLVNAGLLGAAVGAMLGAQQGAALPAAIVGAIIVMAITWPLMKYAVAIMGGVFGAMVGASMWNTFNQNPDMAWAGAMMGLIFCSLLCFILFRGCVMTFTSLQGAVMVVFGLLGLMLKYDDIGPRVLNQFQSTHFLMPMAIFIPTIAGVIFQQYNDTSAGGPPAPAKK